MIKVDAKTVLISAGITGALLLIGAAVIIGRCRRKKAARTAPCDSAAASGNAENETRENAESPAESGGSETCKSADDKSRETLSESAEGRPGFAESLSESGEKWPRGWAESLFESDDAPCDSNDIFSRGVCGMEVKYHES